MSITKTLDLFAYEVGHIYDAEHRFLESQQEMVQKASDQDLEKALQEHIEQTRLHIRNLEQVFDLLDLQPRRQTSHVAQWLVNEAQQSIQQAQGEEAIHQPLAEFGLFREFLVEVERLGIHGQGREQHVIHFGDGPPRLVFEHLSNAKLLKILPGHTASLPKTVRQPHPGR